MLKVIPCFFSLVMICFIAFAQDNKYKNYKYEWSAEKPPEIKVEEQFKDADAVILEEKTVHTLSTGTISRKIRIKFLSEEGIKKYATFILPPTDDFAGDHYSLAYWNKDKYHRPLGEHSSIIYFVARKLQPDGSVKPISFSDKTEKFIYYYNKIDQTYYSWFITLQNISVGDEVEVAFAYQNLFNFNNYFNRIFFNSEIPKQRYELKIRYPNTSMYFFQNHNGVALPDTGVYKGTNPNSIEYTWHAQNLKGCIIEKKSRSYLELPFVSFYSHQGDYGTLSANRAYIEKNLPYPWEFIFLGNNNYLQKTEAGYVNYLPEFPTVNLSKKDPETIAVKKLVEETCGSDSNKVSCMNKVHTLLSDSFDYEKNYDPQFEYMNEDYSKVHKSINAKKLYEEDRLDLYNRICKRLDIDYYHCRLYDKRVSRMNYNEYYPSANFNLYYVLPYKNSFLFYYPKENRTGYYANELPFYFEDINTILIPQTVAHSEKNDPNKDIKFPRISTPFSSISENTRTTNVMCNVSFATKLTTFETRLNLSGQFSTLTRSFYLYGEMDSTLEACYYNPVYELSSSSKLISKEMTSRKATFPYECNFKFKYTDGIALSSPYNGTYKLSLKNWFNNLYDSSLEVKNRVTAYYPDFVYSDIHRYMIKLDKAIEITNLNDFNFKEENSYGKYVVTLKAMDETSYLLETTLIVNAEKVEPHKIGDVKSIFNKIEKMNVAELELKEK